MVLPLEGCESHLHSAVLLVATQTATVDYEAESIEAVPISRMAWPCFELMRAELKGGWVEREMACAWKNWWNWWQLSIFFIILSSFVITSIQEPRDENYHILHLGIASSEVGKWLFDEWDLSPSMRAPFSFNESTSKITAENNDAMWEKHGEMLKRTFREPRQQYKLIQQVFTSQNDAHISS